MGENSNISAVTTNVADHRIKNGRLVFVLFAILLCAAAVFAYYNVTPLDNFLKFLALWVPLVAALLAAWISYDNTTRQLILTAALADQQQLFTKELDTAKAEFTNRIEIAKQALAAELEVTKVRINFRYKAQESLNEVAMVAADRVHELQTEEPGMAATLLARIQEARDEMRKKRGALLMVPKNYQDRWKDLLQHITFIVDELRVRAGKNSQMDVRTFYDEGKIAPEFTDLWRKFEKEATGNS